MIEIEEYKMYEREAFYKITVDDKTLKVLLEFTLEDCYEDCFDPGSYLGYYEKRSGKQPEDVELNDEIFGDNDEVVIVSEELKSEILETLTEHLMENYDYSKF